MASNVSQLGVYMIRAAMSNGTSAEIVTAFIDHMHDLPQNERVIVFQALGDYFCRHCGVEQPPGDCHCNNDE